MRIIAVDDEPHALRSLKRIIKSELPDCEAAFFDTSEDALAYAKENQTDIAFLDIQMGSMSGLVLAKHLKDIYGKTNIIFVTGFSRYALDAHKLHSAGYLLKPITVEALREAMENLRHPIAPPADKHVRVQTFGNFEVFADGKPLSFARSKAKELFAYLISREGAMCSNNEIIAAIWENKVNSESTQSQFRHLVSDLTRTLEAAGAGDVLIKQRGYLAVVPDALSCDLFDVAKGDASAMNNYMGEFMAQYSWAEFGNAYLERLK